jgi:hypothetical protein
MNGIVARFAGQRSTELSADTISVILAWEKRLLNVCRVGKRTQFQVLVLVEIGYLKG